LDLVGGEQVCHWIFETMLVGNGVAASIPSLTFPMGLHEKAVALASTPKQVIYGKRFFYQNQKTKNRI
jgi:hypothetical protein